MEPEVTFSVVQIELTSYPIWCICVYSCTCDRVSKANSPLLVCLLFTLVSLVVPASSSIPFLLPLPVVASAAAAVPLSAAAPPPATAPAARPPVAQKKAEESYGAHSADH